MNVFNIENGNSFTPDLHSASSIASSSRFFVNQKEKRISDFYVTNSYLAMGLSHLKSMVIRHDLIILEEERFINVSFMLLTLYWLMKQVDVSVLIITSRSIDGAVARFFISPSAPLSHWKKRMQINNAAGVHHLYYYYQSICGGANLTEKERFVLTAMCHTSCRRSVARQAELSHKSVSLYYVRIKNKLGITNNAKWNHFKHWMFPQIV